MPRNWTENAMAAALAEFKRGMSIRKAAEKFSVPRSTLGDRVTGRIADGARWGKETTLKDDDEAEMLQVAHQRAEMGIGLTKGTFLRFAGVLADKRGLKFKNGKPSEMWWRSFKGRHDSFSLRTPEPTASVRHDAMSRLRIAKYFSALKGVLEKNDLAERPQRIWNMDETGESMVHRPSLVIAKKGSKTVHSKICNSREMVTVIACGNAIGEIISPHFIVPGKTRKKLEGYDLKSVDQGSPIHGANFSVSDSGWTKEGIGRLWFKETFIPSIGTARPQLLIFDGHGSHNNVEFIELARTENIILIELPSHTSHWTQPFDRSVFKSLKSHWNLEVERFINATGIPVGHSQFLKLFGNAWGASMTPSNIKNGFRATGISPYNPGAIPNEAYSVCNTSDPSILQATSLNGSVLCDPTLAVPAEECELTTDNSAGISSVTISLQLETDGIVDLPLMVDRDGNFILDNPSPTVTCQSSDSSMLDYDNLLVVPPSSRHNSQPTEQTVENVICTTPSASTTECSAAQALQVIESAIDSKQISIYHQAFTSNIDLHDSMYQTWKMYKVQLGGEQRFAQQTNSVTDSLVQYVANESFPLPSPKTTEKSSKRAVKHDSGYFVISAEEAYAQKKEAVDEKKRKLIEKEQRRLERENNKIIRLKEKEIKNEMKRQKKAQK